MRHERIAERSTSPINYRPDIDGLRAIAIIPVVMFHANFEAFAGGFVGVDIFFVISGFLITKILLGAIENGQFSIVHFYERRARRILPALFAMLLAVQLAGLLILLPTEYVSLSKTSIATISFVSNIWFWYSSNSYFDTETETLPLLHTWSLAVEEQFYIVFPILLFCLMLLGRRVAFWAIVIISLGSFAMGVLATRADLISAFYLTQNRAWELGIGSLLVLWYKPWPTQYTLREVLAICGATAILIAIATYDRSTPFPGYAALLPALGAAAIIISGTSGPTLIARLLSLRPLVFVGLISYSLYLWHWPVFAYLRILNGSVELDLLITAVAIATSLVIAALSWAYIEAPFRRPPSSGFSRLSVFRISAVAAIGLVGFAAFVSFSEGIPSRFQSTVYNANASGDDENPDQDRCMVHGTDPYFCTLPAADAEDQPLDFFLWGDSHADALMPGVVTAAEHAGLTGLGAGKWNCPPLLNAIVVHKGIYNGCEKFNDHVIEFLRSRDDIPLVILAARWANWAEGNPPEGGKASVFMRAGETPNLSEDRYRVFFESLRDTVEAIRGTGRKILFVGHPPEIGWNVPKKLSAHFRWGVSLPEVPTKKEVQQRQSRANAAIANFAQLPDVYFISLAEALCRPVCKTHNNDGWALYNDDDHLSVKGARQVAAPLVLNAFGEIFR